MRIYSSAHCNAFIQNNSKVKPWHLCTKHNHIKPFSSFYLIAALSSAVISSWTVVSLQVSWDSGQTWETFVFVKWADYLHGTQKVCDITRIRSMCKSKQNKKYWYKLSTTYVWWYNLNTSCKIWYEIHKYLQTSGIMLCVNRRLTLLSISIVIYVRYHLFSNSLLIPNIVYSHNPWT